MRGRRRFVDVETWDPSSPEWRRLLRQLPGHEQQQVARFLFAKDQKLALASRLLQRQLVRELFDVSVDAIEIRRTPENKPFWKRPETAGSVAPSTWNYNVSHHGTIVAIASEFRELVGVDVVRLSDRPHRKTSVEEFFRAFEGHFNPSEWDYIRGVDPVDEDGQYSRFYRLWSLKEAYIKAVGIGLGFSLLRAEFIRADSAQKDDWQLRLDGQLASDWQFKCTLVNATHLVSVALGPLTAMWKPETSSIFPPSEASSLAAPVVTGIAIDDAPVDEEPPVWQEWTLHDLLQ
ncbi:hypothetical protein BBJ28_00003338 [Nothophytophthora sp. Chile5]|nr:hypothetical protein BBJ28_00003338 [Nothophytophthora sp. Chile5]